MGRSRRRGLAALAAAVAAASLAACAGKGPQPGAVADAAAPPRSAFRAYPEAELAGVKSPHAYEGKPLCQRCHAPDLKLAAEPIALCHGCHPQAHKSHPVNVVQKGPSGTLPLLAGGKVACHTCHDPHKQRAGMREPVPKLCLECHPGL